MNIEAVRKILRRECDAAGGQKYWAASAGVSDSHVSAILRREKPPGPTVLNALGLERVERATIYRRTPRPRPGAGKETKRG